MTKIERFGLVVAVVLALAALAYQGLKPQPEQQVGVMGVTNLDSLALRDNLRLSNGYLINSKGAVTVTDQLYVTSQVAGLNGVTVAGNVTTTGQIVAGNGVAVSGGITAEVNSQNFMLPSVVSATIAYNTSGAVVTIPDGQVWIVKDVVLHVLTNFDCTGDNCAMTVGDGNDADGFLVLADAELQAADSEGTGFAAGWQGLVAATRGVYQDATTFVYAPSGAAETIDVAISGTDPAAGAAVLYVFYTRVK